MRAEVPRKIIFVCKKLKITSLPYKSHVRNPVAHGTADVPGGDRSAYQAHTSDFKASRGVVLKKPILFWEAPATGTGSTTTAYFLAKDAVPEIQSREMSGDPGSFW